MDQRPVERRRDVLVYTTTPLKQDTEVIGPVQVVLYVATSARDTDFTAKLVDVFPDGYARNLTDGILRLRYRNSLETPELAKPGEMYRDHDRRRRDQQRVPEGAPHPRRDFEQQLPAVRSKPEHRRSHRGRDATAESEPDRIPRPRASVAAGVDGDAGGSLPYSRGSLVFSSWWCWC